MIFVFPWQVLVFFISFSFISFALEQSGFFRWCAYKTTKLAKHDGVRLFNFLFLVCAIITFFTANDIVILTLTPFILHIGLHHDKHPKAYLFMLFFVANTGSLGHLLGNLTNIMIADVIGVSFMGFLEVLFIPMIAALIVEYLILRIMFNNEIKRTFSVKEVELNKLIENKYEMKLSLILLGLVITLAIFEPIHRLPLWSYSFGAFIFMLVFTKYNRLLLAKRMPWKMLIGVSILFVIVNFIPLENIISLISSSDSFTVIISAVVISSLLSALINNLPSTILMSSVLAGLSLSNIEPLVYSTIVGSNIGANLIISGSLAGLMWLHLIREKGFKITWAEFSKRGFAVTIPAIIVISIVLWVIL